MRWYEEINKCIFSSKATNEPVNHDIALISALAELLLQNTVFSNQSITVYHRE